MLVIHVLSVENAIRLLTTRTDRRKICFDKTIVVVFQTQRLKKKFQYPMEVLSYPSESWESKEFSIEKNTM